MIVRVQSVYIKTKQTHKTKQNKGIEKLLDNYRSEYFQTMLFVNTDIGICHLFSCFSVNSEET